LQSHELGGQLHWRVTPALRLRFTVGSAVVLLGLKPMQALTWEGVFGARTDLATSEHATTSIDLTARPAHGLGVIAIDDASSFTECHGKAPCNNLAYELPLSYQGPSGRLVAAFDLLDQLSLGASAKVESRRYLEPSFVRSVPASRKTREDVRYRLRT
jgi:hypothetical protein